MRCFYCSRIGMAASEEHIPSKFLGSRLKTRHVCKECNERAGREIDNRFADYVMVQMPRALADVRSIDHQSTEPSVETDAIVSTTGEPARIRFSPHGREVRRARGELVRDVVEVKYGFDSDLWVRFTAKVALGCASKLLSDDWLDEPLARAVRDLLWHRPPIDHTVWPQGVPGWPGELDVEHPVRQALGERRHLVGLTIDHEDPSSTAAVAVLFGGQIVCRLPLPGVACSGSGQVWILDWRSSNVPQIEDCDVAIERLLREQGWSMERIDVLRGK